MKIYFSVVEETHVGNFEGNKQLMTFLQSQGHKLYRAPYVFSEDHRTFLRKELKIKRDATYSERRKIHLKWIDNSDLLLADVSYISEGMLMIVQRALDKPAMGLNKTPIILIRDKNKERKFGSLIKGLIEARQVVYFEYENINEVIKNWPKLLKKAKL